MAATEVTTGVTAAAGSCFLISPVGKEFQLLLSGVAESLPADAVAPPPGAYPPEVRYYLGGVPLSPPQWEHLLERVKTWTPRSASLITWRTNFLTELVLVRSRSGTPLGRI